MTGIAQARGLGVLGVRVYVRDEFLAAMEQDLDQVFIGQDGQEFAEDQNSVTYTHATGEVENYPVLFDNPFATANVNSEAVFSSIKPQIIIQETKLVRPLKKNDRIVVRGNAYFVEDHHSDGVGLTTIFLRRK
jgi:hypothetical protein